MESICCLFPFQTGLWKAHASLLKATIRFGASKGYVKHDETISATSGRESLSALWLDTDAWWRKTPTRMCKMPRQRIASISHTSRWLPPPPTPSPPPPPTRSPWWWGFIRHPLKNPWSQTVSITEWFTHTFQPSAATIFNADKCFCFQTFTFSSTLLPVLLLLLHFLRVIWHPFISVGHSERWVDRGACGILLRDANAGLSLFPSYCETQ